MRPSLIVGSRTDNPKLCTDPKEWPTWTTLLKDATPGIWLARIILVRRSMAEISAGAWTSAIGSPVLDSPMP